MLICLFLLSKKPIPIKEILNIYQKEKDSIGRNTRYNMSKVIEYNKWMSEKLGWKPEWFDCAEFNEELIEKIKEFQREAGIESDGYCGAGTFRRLLSWRAEEIEKSDGDHLYSDHIICHGDPVPIGWDKVVLWSDEKGLKAKEGCYKRVDGKRDINLFVNHWDVCLSSAMCQRVLDQRGISVHFLIDNDGTIYQTLDTTHIAWHAGNANSFSVGVEITNGFYLKHQNKYVRNGFGERPVVKDAIVNGNKLEDHTGFYPVQIDALKALTEAIHKGLNIPLETPKNITGTEYTDTMTKSRIKGYRGFVHHYHLTKRKTDCGGLDLTKIIKAVKDGS